MRLNEKISENFELSIENSSKRILNELSIKKQNQTWSDSIFTDGVDFKKIEIKGNSLEIIRMPSVVNPFKAHGKITFDFLDIDKKVIVRCKILPHNGAFPFIVGFHFTFFAIWASLLFLTIRDKAYALLFVILTSVVFGLIAYLGLVFTKWGLLNYSKKVIRELMMNK